MLLEGAGFSIGRLKPEAFDFFGKTRITLKRFNPLGSWMLISETIGALSMSPRVLSRACSPMERPPRNASRR
jgi:hypothetical protein